jgi:hypothetical protein
VIALLITVLAMNDDSIKYCDIPINAIGTKNRSRDSISKWKSLGWIYTIIFERIIK